jgi:serine protease DegQ
VETLRPDWLPIDRPSGSITINEAPAVQRTALTGGKGARADSYNDAVRVAAPAVVSIDINGDAHGSRDAFSDDPRQRRQQQNRRFNEAQGERTLASGVIVSKDGYLLTNRHVIEGADEITVSLPDTRSASARVVGSDVETDLAVLKIELHDLPAITLGRIDEVHVGDVVLAIGNPFNVGQTVTMGIVSALGRNHLNLTNFENYIQTDAAINPGNSGGALVNASGHLIGINSAIFSKGSGGSLGIGFAVPVSTVKEVLEGIIASGEVIRGYIGVEPQDISPAEVEALTFGRSKGAFISGVYRGGPADQAGVRPGDILIDVDGHAITDTITMLDAIARLKPGSAAKLKLLRKRDEIDVTVKVAARPKAGPAPEN